MTARLLIGDVFERMAELAKTDPDDLRPVVFDAVVTAWTDGHVAVTTAVVAALVDHFGGDAR